MQAFAEVDGGCSHIHVGDHVVWLLQLENGHVEWEDTYCKLEFHRALIWNSAV